MSLKIRLLLGAAAPLVFALPAAAQVSISTGTVAPINTSTANSGAASDVEVTSTGSIVVASAPTPNVTIVTVDSSNKFTNSGTLSVNNSDGGVGVRILPGFTNSYIQSGSINLTEDYARTDTDNDGDLDGAFASGVNRTGILVSPGGTMNGNIDMLSGAITVEGNSSAGVSVQSILNGNYRQRATISVTGDNAMGVDFQKDVTGNINLSGATTVQGVGARGVNIGGNVGGEFMIGGAITATGFTSTSVSNYVDPDFLQPGDPTSAEILDPDDLLIGGVGLTVRGNLARGLLVNGAATGGADPTADVKDVVQNFNENRSTGAVSTFGYAPAMLIQGLDGAAGQNIRLSLTRESIADTLDDDKDSNVDEIIGVFNYDFGLMNRGTISGNGLNTGFSSTGLRIAGSADGTHTTIIDGGIFNSGTIVAQAFEADAVGIDIGAGASTPQLVNQGTISTGVNTETTNDATTIRIGVGASLPSLTNNGIIGATVRGYDGDAVAIRDLSGTLTNVRNTSRIVAGYNDDDTSDDITSGTGRAIALDLSHGSSNVLFTQTDAVDNARLQGEVLFGAGSDRADILSGQVNGNIDFGTAGADTLNLNSGDLIGDAVFHGSTANVTVANGGRFAGDLTLGAAASTLNFTGSTSSYFGAITGTGAINMTVDGATMNNNAAGTLNLNTMNLQNGAKVGFVINNARIAGNVPVFNVGTANIAANTIFTPIFEEFSNQTFTLRVLNATTLNLGGPVEAMLNTQSPYLFDVSLSRPPATNSLDLQFRVKTPTELGLNTRQADAYDAILDLSEENAAIGAAVTSLPNKEQFLRGWNDLLPGQDAAIMQVLSSNATAAFGATAHRLDLISEKPDAPGGAWAEEFGVYHDSDQTDDRLGVSGGGFGVAAGVDLLSTGTALVGAYSALESLELEEKGRGKAPLNVSQTTLGLYGGWRSGGLAANGAASIGFSKFSSDRQITLGSLIDRAKADWDGQTYNVAGRVSYTQPLGPFDLKPYIAADYISFKQDGYQETAANADLELVAGDAEAKLTTASAGVNLALHLWADDAYVFSPELRAGYRSVLSWDPSPAALRFAGGSTGTTFSLNPGGEPEDAVVAGLGLNVNSQFLNLKLGYDAEFGDNSTTHYGSITLRMAFW
ncbi:MAG TPA: autotransporter outer membrane beta-barrel domain-containing protein [Hyphomonadaceae bacterium]|jgi:uncharacterized protein with beta-barrel porin domain|nr:autotransporter outer membrane beta-barrel domain-containing protein [Hyphomonadaceae bacterium]